MGFDVEDATVACLANHASRTWIELEVARSRFQVDELDDELERVSLQPDAHDGVSLRLDLVHSVIWLPLEVAPLRGTRTIVAQARSDEVCAHARSSSLAGSGADYRWVQRPRVARALFRHLEARGVWDSVSRTLLRPVKGRRHGRRAMRQCLARPFTTCRLVARKQRLWIEAASDLAQCRIRIVMDPAFGVERGTPTMRVSLTRQGRALFAHDAG